jgi:hypothetical protein
LGVSDLHLNPLLPLHQSEISNLKFEISVAFAVRIAAAFTGAPPRLPAPSEDLAEESERRRSAASRKDIIPTFSATSVAAEGLFLA